MSQASSLALRERTWDLHGSALYSLALSLLGNQRPAARAVTRGVVEVLDTTAHPEPELLRRPLSGAVYRQCEQADATVGETRPDHLSALLTWLADLTAHQRAVLVLCTYGGHSYREAAEVLDLSPTEAAGLLTSGLRRLRERASGATPARRQD